jgi:hypothetical protein
MNKTCLPIAMQLCERVNEHCTTIRKKLMILFFVFSFYSRIKFDTPSVELDRLCISEILH